MTQVAMQPDMEPTVKGLTSDMTKLSLGLSTLRVIRNLYNAVIRKNNRSHICYFIFQYYVGVKTSSELMEIELKTKL